MRYTQARSKLQRSVCITVPIHFQVNSVISRFAILLTSAAHFTQLVRTRVSSSLYTSSPELTADPASQPPSTQTESLIPIESAHAEDSTSLPATSSTSSHHRTLTASARSGHKCGAAARRTAAKTCEAGNLAQGVRSLTRLAVPR
jgi:hypothetical protein